MDVNTPREKTMHEPDLIDHYVFGLWRCLPMRKEVIDCILEEVEVHLRSSAERDERAGLSAEDAQRRAIERFGTVEEVSASLVEAHRLRGLGRAIDIWVCMHPLDRLAVAFAALSLPWSLLNLLRGGAEIEIPLGLGAFLVGLLSGYLSVHDGRSFAASLSVVIVACVFSYPVTDALRQHPINNMRDALSFMGEMLPLATFVLGFAAIGILGSAAGRRIRWGHGHTFRIADTADHVQTA